MGQIYRETAVAGQEMLAEDVYSMWLEAPEMAEMAAPGQFLSVYPKDSSRLLPRPISICEIDRERGRLRIVYRVAGAGTREFAGYRAGDLVKVMGPLGNGFPMEEADGKRAFLVGGGIGIPPMLELAKRLKCERQMVLGYRDELFLDKEFEAFGPVAVATEDGSAGVKGNVLDAIRAGGLKADMIYACGPAPMLRALKEYAVQNGLPCYVSLEERMACGIGACLACVCRTKEVDSHSQVRNARVCKDGPVFEAREIEL